MWCAGGTRSPEPVGDRLAAGGEAGPALNLDGAVPGQMIAVGRDEILRCWDVLSGRHLGDVPSASCAATVTEPGVFAIGHLDGSITVTSL